MIESAVNSFGSLHSIFCACRFSRLLQMILNKSLLTLAVIYVDDATLLATDPYRLRACLFVTCALFKELRIPLAYNKIETQMERASIITLGVELTRFGVNIGMSVQIKQVKMTLNLIEYVANRIRRHALTLTDVQQLLGRLNSMSVVLGRVNGVPILTCVLYPFGVESFFQRNTRRTFIRRAFLYVVEEIRLAAQPDILGAVYLGLEEYPVRASVADASLEGWKSKTGGFVSLKPATHYNERPELQPEVDIARPWHIDNDAALTEGIPFRPEVFVMEMMAILVNIHMNLATIRDQLPTSSRAFLLLYCDDQAVTYSLLKNSTGVKSVDFAITLAMLRLLNQKLCPPSNGPFIEPLATYVKSKNNPADILTRLEGRDIDAGRIFPQGFEDISQHQKAQQSFFRLPRLGISIH